MPGKPCSQKGARKSGASFALPVEGYRIATIDAGAKAPAFIDVMLNSTAAKDGVDNPQKTHNRTQQATTEHKRTDHNRTQQATTEHKRTGHNRTQQTTTDHNRPQQDTTGHNRTQQTTTEKKRIERKMQNENNYSGKPKRPAL
ncbi:MAG: hypothetical protein FWH55_09700 [Oscillospiraceae bacterium]|nr:hypothetical protein [Oscillospiraceae bacterium]